MTRASFVNQLIYFAPLLIGALIEQVRLNRIYMRFESMEKLIIRNTYPTMICAQVQVYILTK